MTARQVRRVAIVGMGPRGLSILQQLSELADELPEVCTLDVHLIDPGDGGQGTHPTRQPAHLLTNTLASQVTMFSDGRGPSFTEWAERSGYREFAAEYYPTGGDAGDVVGEHSYLPRQILGSYLSWVFDETVRSLPSRIRVVHHRDRAVDIEAREGEGFAVYLAKGFVLPSDYVFLATGHCERIPTEEDRTYAEFAQAHAHRNPRLIYCPSPYPVDRLQEIAPGSSVLVQGFGLTAHDVISELTVGRGGRFYGSGSDMAYRPSGREPRIRLFSRQCLPFAARGVNQKGLTGQHQPRFFTKEAVQSLKEQAARYRGDPRLGFEEEVLPLLLKEMGYAYRTVRDQHPVDAQEYELSPADRRVIEDIIDPLRDREFENQDAFTKFFVDHVENDLEHAERGNLTSPVKAATDVLRDTRGSLREAVEFSGLTPASHRTFIARYVPVMNRISFGPPRHRNHQLLALLRAGIVDLAGGPGCRVVLDRGAARFAIRTDYADGAETRRADALVIARLDAFHPEQDRSPLTANLLERGIVRPYANGPFKPGGIDIDERGRLVTAAGQLLRTAWAVGYPVEGPRFYTHALPRHAMPSQFTADANVSVRDMIEHIRHRNDIPREESMPVQTGSQLPYPEFRRRHQTEQPTPVVWQWETLAKEIEAAEHTPYGTLTLAAPDGRHEIVPGTSMTFQVVRPGERTASHSHSWWHLYFVRTGSGTVIFDDTQESSELGEGDILLIPAWSVHHFENQDGDVDLLLLNMSNLPQLAGLHNNFSKEHA